MAATKTISSVNSDFFSAIKSRSYRFFDAKVDDSCAFGDIHVDDQSSNICIIYGDNASGKSLFSSILSMSLKTDLGASVRNSGMCNRTSGGIQAAMIFGDESEQSTGATSVSVVQKCLSSTQKETKVAIAVLDEPDFGLSPRYAKALGRYIAQQMKGMPERGLILVSHSEPLISAFLEEYANPVSYLGIGTSQAYREWVNSRDEASIDELLNMVKSSMQIRRAIALAIK